MNCCEIGRVLGIEYFTPLHKEINYLENNEATYKNVRNKKNIQNMTYMRQTKLRDMTQDWQLKN